MISRNEATETLAEIVRAEDQSRRAYGYLAASPHLILWGLIWVFGYGAMALNPGAGRFWPYLAGAGLLLSLWIGTRSKLCRTAYTDWRYATTMLVAVLFAITLLLVLAPRSDAQVSALFPLLTGLAYALIGIWGRSARMWVLGVLISALTLTGYFLVPQHFMLWLAVVGGGGLLLGGFWLRSV